MLPHEASDVVRLPSDTWTGFDTWGNDPNHWIVKKISLFLCSLDVDALQQISTSRRGGRHCTISDRFACGSENILKELVYEDGIVWVARIPLERQAPEVIRSEVTTMRYIKEHTTIPIPEVMGYEDSTENSLSCQYILMEAIHGRTRCEPGALNLLRIPDDKITMVFAQLADILLQLSCLRFHEIGSLNIDEKGHVEIGDVYGNSTRGRFKKCSTPAEYFQFIIANTERSAETSIHDSHKAAKLSTAKLKAKLASKFMSCSDAYPLSHPDFQAQNILFDDDFNIVAIIDWSYAHTVPIECLCYVPGGGFVLPDFQLDLVGPEWMARATSLQIMRKRFRNAFLEALSTAETAIGASVKRNEDTKTENQLPLQLSHIFHSIDVRIAVVFSEYYHALDKEIFDLLENKIYISY
jgi:hypothetical protein